MLELVVEAGENPKLHEASRDNTSPAALVTAIVGHENSASEGEVVTISVMVEWLVTVRVRVTTLVFVSKGVQETCRSHSKALRIMAAGAAALLVVAVVLGGLYKSAQSELSLSVAFLELVTVMGMQVKSVASLGSSISVSVTTTSWTVVEVVVVVLVLVVAGQKEHVPSKPQYAVEKQHSFSQQLVPIRQGPF